MARFDELKTTNNRSVYNRLIKRYRASNGEINCGYCRYHRMENQTHSSSYVRAVGTYDRSPWRQRPKYCSWKWLRKTQYRVK